MRTFCLFLVAPAATAQEQPERIRVVTTLGVLAYAARQVGGDRVEVESLAPPGQDPHYIVPSPDLQKKAAGAKLFVLVGRGLEPWAKNVIDHSGNQAIQPGTDGYVLAATGCTIEELPDQVSREWGDIHPEGNPHVWLDPINMKTIARNIAEALQKLDAAGADEYERNLRTFEQKIAEALFGKELVQAVGARRIGVLERRLRAGELDEFLERWKLQDRLGGWLARAKALRGQPILTYHKTYVYFAKVFGLRIVGELEERPGIPPTPQQRDRAVRLCRQHGVRAILSDSFYPRAAADYVARETGAKVVVTHIDVGASAEVPDYFSLIDRLLDGIREALR